MMLFAATAVQATVITKLMARRGLILLVVCLARMVEYLVGEAGAANTVRQENTKLDSRPTFV